jgi:hypothetical protein
MTLVVTGLLNKQVGFELGISEITVKAHRGRVMRKMKADSHADLVTMATKLRRAPASRHGVPSGRNQNDPALMADFGDEVAQTNARSNFNAIYKT